MSDWEDYYKKSIELERPSLILGKFFEMNLDITKNNKKAIDLGCGSGNDTICLLKNGYNVTAVDKEKEVKNIIEKRVPDNQNLNLIIDTFENAELNKADLIVANMSLCFCSPEHFQTVCKNITNSILPNGYFVGNFLGKKDEWSKDSRKSFIDEQELKEIFKNFEIIYLKEKEFNKQTAKGNMKFWDVYEIIAKKLN